MNDFVKGNYWVICEPVWNSNSSIFKTTMTFEQTVLTYNLEAHDLIAKGGYGPMSGKGWELLA